MELHVNSPNVKYTDNFIESNYDYHYIKSEKRGNKAILTPLCEKLVIRTHRKVPKVGVMLVGWGGNNGTTFTAGLIANKLGMSWPTKRGIQKANWFGSLTQASTLRFGDVHVPMAQVLPTVHPNDLVVDGWDINSLNLAEAMERAQVLEPALQQQLKPHMAAYKPRPSIYNPDFIAPNQP